MKLIDLLEDVKDKQALYSLVEVKDIVKDVKLVTDGDIYFCIKGSSFDGHDNAKLAIDRGALYIVTERELEDVDKDNQIVTDDTIKAYNYAVEQLFGTPSKDMEIIGVTGTNGKTSIVTALRAILEDGGSYNGVGVIGTVNSSYKGKEFVSKLTTPDCYTLNRLLADMRDNDCDSVCMEVSSHALAQRRIGNIRFKSAIFTNLTTDHLDYHIDMESYFKCKKLLFNRCDNAVVNIDDPYGKRLADELIDKGVNLLTYGIIDESALYLAKDIVYKTDGVVFTLRYKKRGVTTRERISINMLGKFSVYNILSCIAVADNLGISMDSIKDTLDRFYGVPGRAEVIYKDRFCIVRDYAHTPDGLYNILASVREYCKGDIILVFGCGGDRDRKKRPLMAKVAMEHADVVIVTNDNPRNEDADKIINEITAGFDEGYQYKIMTDRRKAIEFAMKIAKPYDYIILAGKGHETYQIIGDKTLDFDEKKVVEDIVASRNIAN